MLRRKATRRIIVHCSATPPSMDIGAEKIRQWHMDQGWVDIGYHYVIDRDGLPQDGRPIDMIGAHAAGHNKDSIGICLVGGVHERTGEPEANFTFEQMQTLANLMMVLQRKYGVHLEVLGHRDLPGVAKACPSFDVRHWLASSLVRP